MADYRQPTATSASQARALVAESVISSIDEALRREFEDYADRSTPDQSYTHRQKLSQGQQKQHQLVSSPLPPLPLSPPPYHNTAPTITSSLSTTNSQQQITQQQHQNQPQLQLQLQPQPQPQQAQQQPHTDHSPAGIIGSAEPVEYIEYQRGMHQAPRFLTHIIDYAERHEGQSIHFEASLSPVGDPDLKVEWLFNGRPHVTGSRFHTLHDFGFVVLHIDWLYSRDTGEYICRAKNKFGSATTRAYLKVSPDRGIVFDSQLEDPTSIERLIEMEAAWNRAPEPDDAPVQMQRAAPRFILEPSACAAFEGSVARFSCRITGHPRPRINWLVNGQPVVSGSRYKLTFDGMHHLTIPKCQLSDEGPIEVVAQNPLGECRHVTELRMKRKVDDYRGVLKNSPNPWYDTNLKLCRRLQRASIDMDDDEYFAAMAQKYSHLFSGNSNINNNGSGDEMSGGGNTLSVAGVNSKHIVGYMDTATPDVNLLADSSASPFSRSFNTAAGADSASGSSTNIRIQQQLQHQQRIEHHLQQLPPLPVGDQHPAGTGTKVVLAPAPSTIKRALKQKDSIKLPEASYHIDESVRRRRDEQAQQQLDLNTLKDDILARQHRFAQDKREARAVAQQQTRQHLSDLQAEQVQLEAQYKDDQVQLEQYLRDQAQQEEEMYQKYRQQQQQQYQDELLAERHRQLQQQQHQLQQQQQQQADSSQNLHGKQHIKFNLSHKPPAHAGPSYPSTVGQAARQQQQHPQVSGVVQSQLEADDEELLQLYQRQQLADERQARQVQAQLRQNQQILDAPRADGHQIQQQHVQHQQQQHMQHLQQTQMRPPSVEDMQRLLVSPESRVQGKEIHSHTHKQTQVERHTNSDIKREIIERETIEQQHRGVTRDSIVRGRSASVERGASPAPSSLATRDGSASRQSSVGPQHRQIRIVYPQMQQQQQQLQQQLQQQQQEVNVFEDESLVSPEFVSKIQPCRAFDGDEAKFECVFKGDPVPTLSWFKESKQLKKSNLYNIETDFVAMTSTLIIKRVSRDSNAVYTVKAENVAGSAKSSANLVVESHPMAGMSRADAALQIGSSKRASSLRSSPSSIKADDANAQSIDEDDDKLERVVKSTKTRTLSAAEMAAIVRASPDGQMAPTFLHTIHDLIGARGDLMRFDARVVGSRPIEVRWLRDGDRVRVDKSHKMVLEGDMYTLLILECSEKDVGLYECVASNRVGEARCSATLSINDYDGQQQQASSTKTTKTSTTTTTTTSNTSLEQQAGGKKPQYFHRYNPLMTSASGQAQQHAAPPKTPKLIKKLESQQVIERRPLTLRCIISSVPAVEVFWYKGDQLIKPSKYFKIFKDNEETYCLKLVEAFAEDKGEYKCVARSADGLATIETSAFVTVLPANIEPQPQMTRLPSRTPTPTSKLDAGYYYQ